MNTSLYTINKSINKPIEFKGLKAQYIWWLAIGLVVLLFLFAILYLVGVHPFICLGIVGVCAGFLFYQVYRISKKFGEHGMMKAIARRRVPREIKSYSRVVFVRLKIAISSTLLTSAQINCHAQEVI